jgi:hypothetical protein
MPSFFNHHFKKGVQKQPVINKLFFQPMQKSNTYLSKLLPHNWFHTPPPPPPPPPVSSVFDPSNCIWYYGVLYVRENVAVAKLLEQQNQQEQQEQQELLEQQNQQEQPEQQEQQKQQEQPDDEDAESVSSANSNHPRSIGKQNQLKYLNNGTRLRHCMPSDHWHATFDAETNRIIRTSDGVAFDTLRQFARLHCNEVLGTTSTLNNVWSDPQFQFQDDHGQWHPLSKLKH